MAADLGKHIALDREGILSQTGKIIYLLILFTCSATLLYPFVTCSGEFGISCLFRSLTAVPCPTCGYSRAVCHAVSGDLGRSLNLNPLWLVLVIYQIFMIFISVKAIIKNRMITIPKGIVIAFFVVLGVNWLIILTLGYDFW
ncbi:DUF2752 domain-containing protein [Natronoflexus pectinivorans]|uniref:DUF2752 domain-containing protein n=1 Tax=Natronoflexus pectinivorans TaxID=682526 RepID=UPI00140465A3|nr:DUF2752 domain-containing protein [Natronoflexus pectinivorans]